MKKKILTIILMLSMSVLLLTGCGMPNIRDAIGNMTGQGNNANNSSNNNNNNGNNNPGNNGGNGGNQSGAGGSVAVTSDFGILHEGPNTIRNDMYFYVEHTKADITYEEAVKKADRNQNYLLLGSYSYPDIKDRCPNEADYTFFNDKAMEYAYYEQVINGYRSGSLEAVVPAYLTFFVGYSDEFAEGIYGYTGKSFYNMNDNPFYRVDEAKKKKIHDNLVSKYGSKQAEQYYRNYLKVLETTFMEYYYITADEITGECYGHGSYCGTYFVDIDDNGEGTLTIVDVLIDINTFEMSIQNPKEWLVYDIKMVEGGNSFVLTSDTGFSLRYDRTSDRYLVGYVANNENAYHDIVGIEICDEGYYKPYCGEAVDQSYVDLENALKSAKIVMSDGSVAVNPSIEFNQYNTIKISFSTVYNYDTKKETPRKVSITARYALIGYMHGQNDGFVLCDASGYSMFLFDRNYYLTGMLGEDYVNSHSFEEGLAIIYGENGTDDPDGDGAGNGGGNSSGNGNESGNGGNGNGSGNGSGNGNDNGFGNDNGGGDDNGFGDGNGNGDDSGSGDGNSQDGGGNDEPDNPEDYFGGGIVL